MHERACPALQMTPCPVRRALALSCPKLPNSCLPASRGSSPSPTSGTLVPSGPCPQPAPLAPTPLRLLPPLHPPARCATPQLISPLTLTSLPIPLSGRSPIPPNQRARGHVLLLLHHTPHGGSFPSHFKAHPPHSTASIQRSPLSASRLLYSGAFLLLLQASRKSHCPKSLLAEKPSLPSLQGL